MVSRKLIGIWAFIDFCLLAAGGVSIALAIIWRAPDLLRNLVVTETVLLGGLILGIALALTFVVSVGAIIQRNHVTIGLVVLNWILLLDSIIVVVVGSIVWFATLMPVATFRAHWVGFEPNQIISIQDKFSCCGYMNTTDLVISQGFCAAPLNTTKGCMPPVVDYADFTLNNIFTSVYGFMAIIISLFLATLCVISKRLEQERFRKIDAKRGGRGFV